MLGENKIRALLQQALSYSQADQTEAVLSAENAALTRFANSFIHQNVAESNGQLSIRVALGKKVGVAATNDLSEAGVRRVVESATTIARLQQDNPEFTSLPRPSQPVEPIAAFFDATAAATPEQRARAVSVICKKCSAVGLSGSGALTTTSRELAVANSLGVFAYYPSTQADIKIVVMSDTGSGYAEGAELDYAQLDVEALGDQAIDKAVKSRNPVALPPGDYTVILEEYAVSDILAFLSRLGFSALASQEGRSFMKLGEKVLGDNVSIWDDGRDTSALAQPFDYEGVPRSRLSLIERGVAKALVYDSHTAGKEGKQSTGHALPAPSTFGPLPTNLFMATGAASKETMLASTKKGLWITRFNYTRAVHPLLVIVTGMTRDGTFLIENGELTQPVKNLRFTQSYLDALRNVEMIGNSAKTVTDYLGSARVPALKVGRFSFTGATQF